MHKRGLRGTKDLKMGEKKKKKRLQTAEYTV